MKTKDILIVLVAVVVIGVSVYFLYKMLVPEKSSQTNSTTTQQSDIITGNIDEDTLKILSEKKDYGEATLDNIGRNNPFGPLN